MRRVYFSLLRDSSPDGLVRAIRQQNLVKRVHHNISTGVNEGDLRTLID